MSLPKLYIAGPFRGYPRHNFDLFEEVTADLRWRGYEIVSPAELDLEEGFDPDRSMEEQGFSREAAMRRDIEALLTVEGVAFLPGSGDSPGARAEFLVAESLGLPVYVLARSQGSWWVPWHRPHAHLAEWLDGGGRAQSVDFAS